MGCAVHQLDETFVKSMLKHPLAHLLHLDYYPGDSEYTVREIIKQSFPDLEPLLPAPLMASLYSPNRNKRLLAALQRNDHNSFAENLSAEVPNPWYGEPYYSSLLEIACQTKDKKCFVEDLLLRGADTNTKNRVTGMPLIHATARSGNLDMLEKLLNESTLDINVKDNENRTILHWWARVSEKNPDDKKRLENCFNLILKKDFDIKRGFKDKDSSGNTPFSTAVDREYRDRIILMLDTSSDDTASAHINQVLESADRSFLEAILDYCFESNNEPINSKDLEVKLKSHALLNMTYFAVDSSHKDLLKHPVLSIFVNLKWKKLQYFFFINVIFYVTFLAFLTAYILFSEFCNIRNNRGDANNTDGLLNHNDSIVTCGMTDETRYNTSQRLRIILMVLLVLLFVREVCQLVVYCMDYIKSKENWLELLLICFTFTSCSGLVESIQVNRHLFAIAILLGWFELVLLLGRLPAFSVQTEMLKRVSLTFLSYMARYIVLILAFAFSFYIIFKENVEGENHVLFTNPLISILKTIVMFTGELEAIQLPFHTLPGTSHVIFLLFTFLVAMILLNLLNGLAVGDTGKVREDAETLSLVARERLIKSILRVNFALPYFKKRYLVLPDKKYVLYPNKTNNTGSIDLVSLKTLINEKRERIKKEKRNEHVENWKLFTEKLATLQLQSKKIQQMIGKILTHLEIPES
jgi:ankyrin repeat protein